MFIGAIAIIFMSLQTVKYYQSKSNQWFDFLPSQTILAVKLNTHSHQQVQNTKVFGILKDLHFEQDLIDEFINSQKPITLVLLDNNNQLASGVIVSQADLDIANPKLSTYTFPNENVLVAIDNTLDLTKGAQLDQSKIQYQIKNHPATSFGYIAFSPNNFQNSFFKDKLLTPSQKAVESLLKQYDNVFFNIESDKTKLYISNYLEGKTQDSSYLSLEKIASNPQNSTFHLSFSMLQNRIPKILNLSLEKLLSNFDISKTLYQKFLKSSVSITLDTNNQWHILIDSQDKLTSADLESFLNFVSNYFNPKQTQRTLKTNQETTLNISQNSDSNLSSNKVVLESINKQIKITPQSEHVWNINLSDIHSTINQPNLNFQPDTFTAFENVVDYSKFRLDFLSQLFGPKLPAYSLEVFQRDYSFGKHTLIVIE